MIEHLHTMSAPTLTKQDYLTDFEQHFDTVDASLKLERQQWFREPDVESWAAMDQGDWDTALRLLEQMRPERAKQQQELHARGFVQRRVRVVSTPLTSYLRWELRALRLWAELGEQITILPTQNIQHLEKHRPLPEIVILGGEKATHPVLYDIIYRQGIMNGARKFTDTNLIHTCLTQITALWHQGEDIFSYFQHSRALRRPE